MRRIVFLCCCAAAAALAGAPDASASRYARYGIQDDAWLHAGPGTLEKRLDILEDLGVDLVRYTIRWDMVAKRRPARAWDPNDPAYDWSVPDGILNGLRARKIGVVATLLGSPRWANGGRSWNWAPNAGFGWFSHAASKRYPWIREWTIWNEPNQRRWLRPTTPRVYVRKLLNPAYAWLKRANRRNRVGGGVTAPRGSTGGVSPVAWIRGMRAAKARLDAYAHHPYATRPRFETPWTGGCGHCATITMATLERLVSEVRRNFGNKRIWLTEYAYQTNPPDRLLGVSYAAQARFVGEGAHRAYAAPYVDMLIHFLVRDDTHLPGWQSGLFNAGGTAKPAYRAFQLPLAQVSRSGTRTVLWGQVRPRKGRQPYRLRQRRNGRWVWLGNLRTTDGRGVFRRVVRAGPGSRIQVWSPRDKRASPILVVR